MFFLKKIEVVQNAHIEKQPPLDKQLMFIEVNYEIPCGPKIGFVTFIKGT